MADNFAIWKQHFINQAKGLIPHQEKFYKVASEKGGGGKGLTSGEFKMVSPTQEVVERAKTQPPLPVSIYDPISGLMTHSSGRPRSVHTSYKRKATSANKSYKGGKKRKVGKKKTGKKKLKKSTNKKKKPHKK